MKPLFRILAFLLLVAAAAGAGCDDGAASGGGGGGGPVGALLVINSMPADTTPTAGTNTWITLQFNKPVNYASLAAGFHLYLVTAGTPGSPTGVPVTRVTTFDGVGNGSTAVFAPDSQLLASTATTGAQFYRIQVDAGVTAVDGGRLAAAYQSDFGTSTGPISSILFPQSVTIDGMAFSTGMTLYTKAADFDTGVTLLGLNYGSFLVVNLDSGTGLPGDLSLLYLPGGFTMETSLIPSPVSTTSYSGTLTFYDLSGNSVSDTFTLVYDTDAPAAPTGLTLSAGETSPTSNASVNVDAAYAGPVGPQDTYQIRVSGGALAVAPLATSSPQAVSVPLTPNKVNSLRAVAMDQAGNVSAQSPALSVVHDNLPPSVTAGFTPALSIGANTIGTTSLFYQGSLSGEIGQIEIYDTSSAGGPTLLASQVVLGNFNLPLVLPANTLTTIEVRVFDYDQPGNLDVDGPYDVFPDTQVNPAPTVTEASDVNGACAAPPGNGTCVLYNAGTPPGFRTGSASLDVSGTVEKGSSLQLRPAFTLFVSAAADPSSDIFPAAGDPKPTLTLPANLPFQIELYAKDTFGNQVTVPADAEFIRDTLPPLVPTLAPAGLAAPQAGCASETFTANDPVTGGPVLSLVGAWADCSTPDLSVSALDAPSNPDPTKGESYRVRARNETGTILATTSASAILPAGISLPVPLSPQESFENGIGRVRLSSVDAVGNESGYLTLIIVHRTTATDLLPAIPDLLTNTGGSHNAQALAFTRALLVVTTRPTNATMVTITGHTSPNAAGVELRDSTNTAIVAGPVAPDAATGSFSLISDALATNSSVASLTDTYYLRATGVGTTPLTVDTTLNITHDTNQPATAPTAGVSAPSAGSGLAVVTITAPQSDAAGLGPTIGHARLYTDGACVTAAAVESSASLSPAGPTQISLTGVAVGNSVQVYLEDEAGNQSTPGSRACLLVPAGHIFAGTVNGATAGERGLNFFNLDGAVSVGTYVSHAGFDDPISALYYGPGRLFVLNQEGGGVGLVHYDIASNTLNQPKIALGPAYGGFDARQDRGLVALLDAGTPSLGFLQVDATPAVSAVLSEAFFPDLSAAYGIVPVGTFLFPGGTAAPQAGWTLVLRLKIAFTLSNGDALVFDTAAGDFIVPTPPFSPVTKAGLLAGPNPVDAAIPASAPFYALIADNSGLPGDAGYADATILDFSACPPNCSAADFTSTTLVLTNETGGPINGLAGLRLFPSNENFALAVEPNNIDGTGGALHLLSINWAEHGVSTAKTLSLPGQGLSGSIDLTSDETLAAAVSSDNAKLLVFNVNLAGLTLALDPTPLPPTPGTAPLNSGIHAEP